MPGNEEKTKISEVHYIVHPTYDINISLIESVNLISRILQFASMNGNSDSRLFVYEANGFGHFNAEGDNWREHNESVFNYFLENVRLAEYLMVHCPNLVIGQNKSQIIEGLGGGRGLLDKYIKSRELSLNLEHLVVVGHGVNREASVKTSIELLANKFKAEYGANASYKINEGTTL